MTRWVLKLTLYILLIIGLILLGLAYLLGEVLLDHWHMTENYFLIISFIISFYILSILIYRLLSEMLKPIKEITNMIKDLSKGHYWRRLPDNKTDQALSELINHTNQLAINLQNLTENQHMNEDRLKAIISHMASGLLFVNQRGRIIIINQRLVELLNWDQSYQDKLYYEAGIDEDVVELIRDAFMYEQDIKKQISMEKGLQRLEIDLFVGPVKDLENKVRGIVVVFHDITDLKKLEKVREDFVANVSHELKTPLTSIKGFSETLLDGAMYSEEHLKKFLEIIRQESDRLHRLIQDLLHLSNIEQRKFQLQWEKVDLTELVKDTLMLVESKADSKQIELIFDRDEPAIIEGDSDRIRQILLNLISNAIQYTPEHGTVTVDIVGWESKGYEVKITDTGIGISEVEILRVFERFYRVDKARSRGSGGTGLGLAIVKHLVEAHMGELSVMSDEGKGSTFSVFFYLEKPSSTMP